MTVVVGRGGGSKPKAPKPRPPAGSTPRGQQPVHTAPTKPYLPPSTSSGNNPRGVAIPTRRPKANRNDHAAKTLNTGANPRGVAVKQRRPKDHSGALLHGANPRGVAIKMPHLKGVKPPKIKSSGGGGGILGIGAITIPPIASSALHVITHIPEDIGHVASDIGKNPWVSHTFKDVATLVPGTIEGLGTIGKAVAEDAIYDSTHGKFLGPVPLPGPHVTKIAEQAWKGSVTKSLLTGHVEEALKKFKAHPFDTALEFAGGVGALGRVAGAVARTGALGSKVADVAATAREGREIAPGLTKDVRHYHPNLLRKGVQVAGERVKLPKAVTKNLNEHRMKVRTDYIAGIEKAVGDTKERDLIHEQAKEVHGHTKPLTKDRARRKVAADVASLNVQAIASGKNLLDELRDYRGKLQDAVDSHEHYTPRARKAAQAHIKNITKFMADPDVKALEELASSYAKRQHTELDPELVRLGLQEPGQIKMAPLKSYVAAGHMPDVSIASKAIKSVRAAFHTAALRDVKAAQRDLEQARAELRAAPKSPAAKRAVSVAEANLKTVVAEARGLKKYAGENLPKGSVVTRVEVGHTDTGKPIYGMRRVTPEEIEAHMRAHGKEPRSVAYVNQELPHGRDTIKTRLGLSRGDTPSKTRTGKNVELGAFKPGHTSLADSQLRATRDIQRAKGFDEFVRQSAVHDASGKIQTFFPHEVEHAAEDYERQHGIEVTPVATHSVSKSKSTAAKIGNLQAAVTREGHLLTPEEADPKQRFALVPTTMVKRMQQHMEIDSRPPGLISGVTRQFRNTVLTFSPKWVAGNDIEAALRSALVGAGPRDAALESKVIKGLRAAGYDDAAARLEGLRGGRHYGMAEQQNARVTGAGALRKTDRNLAQKLRDAPVVKQFADAYSNYIVHPVMDFNRRTERVFEKGVLGAHIHRQMREFGASWAAAALHEQKWIDKLVQGYGADPNLAIDAAKYMDKTLGKYNNFSPLMKRYVNSVAPFAPWYFNALRFVYVTMPADHPVAQSVLLAAGKAAANEYKQQRKSLGDLVTTSFGMPSDALATDIKTKGGGYIDVARYTPWGAFEEGPVNFVLSQLGPQYQGAYNATQGLDPFGRPLQLPGQNQIPAESNQAVGSAVNALLTSLLGPVEVLHRIIAAHGNTEYSGSTLWNTAIKPNTHHGAPGILGGVERTLIPGFPVYLNRNTPGETSGNGGFKTTKGATFSGPASGSGAGTFKVTKGATFK